MKEVTVENYFVLQVERRGGIAEKFATPGRRHAQDRLVRWPAMLWEDGKAQVHFVELKKPDGKIRSGQKRRQTNMRRDGFVAEILSSHAQVDLYLQHFGPRLEGKCST